MSKQRVRLRAIVDGVDFRKSEATLLAEFREDGRFPGELKGSEVFLFLSRRGDQCVWILRGDDNVVDSRKWRMSTGQKWHPHMLQNYANEAELEIVGIRSFEEIHGTRGQTERDQVLVREQKKRQGRLVRDGQKRAARMREERQSQMTHA